MVTPPKLLRRRPGIDRHGDLFGYCAERSAHGLTIGLDLVTGTIRLYWRCLIASRKFSSHIPPHHLASTPAIKATTQPRQNAVAEEQSPAKLNPTPIKNPIMDPRIIKDFIRSQVLSRIAAITCRFACFNESSMFSGVFLREQQRRFRPLKFTGNFLPSAEEADGTFCA
jgi:hypothetical protein